MWISKNIKVLIQISTLLIVGIFNLSNPQKIHATTVSDNFNRSDGGLGSNWTTITGTQDPEIINNLVKVPISKNASLQSAFWSSNSFSNNQYVQAIFPNNPNLIAYGPGIGVRLADSRGYILWWGNNADKVTIWRMDSALSWTQIAASNSLTISNTDLWKLTAVGSTLKGYQNGNLVVQTTDATYSNGNPGVWLYYNSNQLDDWSAGDIGLPIYTLGGTVSGLTGTVVLQNNGYDNLSISSNGAFVFDTELAGGENYAITIYSQPSGKICTVTNGTGTITSANVTDVRVSCISGTYAEDNFNRANGSLGSSWTDFSAGGLIISSQTVVGTLDTSGSIRTAETYTSDQYSELTLTSNQLVENQWIGPTVRTGNGGQDLYVGLYWWNNGSPVLRIYKRNSGVWTQLGSQYSCGPLPAGTKLKVMVVGNTVSFLLNDVEKIAAYDASITSGAPGIAATSTNSYADNWTGGDADFEAHYLSTDANGVKSYNMISAYNGYGPHVLRVLEPTNPTPNVAHNIIYVLPVEEEGYTTYGDGLETLRQLNAHNQYNLTIVAPQFHVKPWYADHPTDANIKYESFMAIDLAPWVNDILETTGNEQHWLLGFSKSGMGSMSLIFKHPDLFTLAAVWDFPANMSTYDQYDSAANYGTNNNFLTNYRLTSGFLEARKSNFLINNRIWISGFNVFHTDISDFDALLTSKNIVHTLADQQDRAHNWNSGWVPLALSGLYQNSLTYREDTIPPTITAFTIPASSTSKTISITTFTANDNISVTGYLLTESASTPSVNDLGWSTTAPTTYTFQSIGNNTLWAWVKDADGNISPGMQDSINITESTPATDNTSSGNYASAPICSDQEPGQKAPWLFSASAMDSQSIKLFFTAAGDPVDKYVLEYGTKSGDYPYGIQNMGIISSEPMTFTVNYLQPNTIYYFRIKGGNGCATGPWSNEITAKTQDIISFDQLNITKVQLEKVVSNSCKSYIIQDGDTLWSISESLLGNGSKFQEIIEQNKKTYPSLIESDLLKIGWVLKINCEGGIHIVDEAPKEGYVVKVKVVDDNNQPVEGASVTLHSTPRTEITDSSGIALFQNVESGDHKLIIKYDKFEGEQSINLTGNTKEFDLNISVEEKPFSLSPLGFIIIGFMSLIIIILTILLYKNKKITQKFNQHSI